MQKNLYITQIKTKKMCIYIDKKIFFEGQGSRHDFESDNFPVSSPLCQLKVHVIGKSWKTSIAVQRSTDQSKEVQMKKHHQGQ